jgi:hypothetical protein
VAGRWYLATSSRRAAGDESEWTDSIGRWDASVGSDGDGAGIDRLSLRLRIDDEDRPGLAHRVRVAHHDVDLPEPFEDRRDAPSEIRDRHDD